MYQETMAANAAVPQNGTQTSFAMEEPVPDTPGGEGTDSMNAAPAQDPAALAADGLSYLERDEGRYGLVFPDEPSALDMVYLQTDPAVAAQHDFPTQLLAWVDPAQPDDLLIATHAADGWQTACYPGWGAWLHFDLAVGAIGLP